MLENYEGKPLSFESPSGYNFTIREQTGDDDDILSSMDDNSTEDDLIHNINKFVLGIIIKHDIHEGILTLEDVINLKLRDKHHIVLKSRIHSLGSAVSFKIRCSNKRCKLHDEKVQYTEDLSKYDNDFKGPKTDAAGKEIKPFKYQVQKYTTGKAIDKELTLSSNKVVKYDLFTGRVELTILELAKQNTFTTNTQFIARRLHIKNGTEWQRISAFGIFSPADMKELRASLQDDKQFIMASECICQACGNEMVIPFVQIKDFFFPSEITNM